MGTLSPLTRAIGSVATIATPNASRYLRQLCEHFQRRLPVSFDPRSGQIVHPAGECRLVAGEDVLMLLLVAPGAGQLGQLKDVLARHLLRFASREDMLIVWRPV
jgi:hypothetical protein